MDLANEAHDCQRLVIAADAGPEFGPLVGTFSHRRDARSRADFATARPAVTVYSWGAAGGSYAADYAPLELGAGAHCLWLQNPAGGGRRVGAPRSVPGACGAAATVQSEPDFALAVFERTYPGAAGGAYPRTARWEWETWTPSASSSACDAGEAWCAVMPAGASAPRTTSLPEPLARLRAAAARGVQLVRRAASRRVPTRLPAARAPGPWGHGALPSGAAR